LLINVHWVIDVINCYNIATQQNGTYEDNKKIYYAYIHSIIKYVDFFGGGGNSSKISKIFTT